MLNNFTTNSFFNDRKEKVFHYKIETVNDEGKIVETTTLVGEIPMKVIRPLTDKVVNGKTIENRVILHTHKRLNFYREENASDIILWKGRFYKIMKEWDRREYGFRYELEYMFKDE